jgi:transposase
VSHASRRAGKPQPVFLPPYSPELNPIERLWLHLRDNRLSHCVFQTTGEIVDTYCDAHVAGRVAEYIFDQGLARVPRPDDIASLIRARTYHPAYPE